MSTVAVIGAGAVGSYYGARLAQAGHDVRFLMRRDFDAVAARGLRVRSKDGDFALDRPAIARRPEAIGPVDWVICALKATAIEEARALVAPCVADRTRVLVLMNGLGLEERFAEWFGPARVFGGLAFTCINRGEPGEVHHLDYGPVTIGHLEDDPGALAAAATLWEGAAVEVTTSPSLLAARWQKLCWNIPFNGLAVTAGGITTDRILADPGLRAAAAATIGEVATAGNADLAAHGERARLDPTGVTAAMIAATDAMAVYRPSTMIDFVEGRATEVDAIFGEPLRRAEALGVAVPHIALLTALVRSLDAQRPSRRD
ncbi:MAG: 2-dehydropantoate 2-reductase [Chloroflexi bacterium]|nr:2-dehydropantoate 2-reductase [Chloroflexota bacterium]